MRTGKHADITEKIIKAFYAVYNTLGYGFSEKVYHLALVIELQHMGMLASSEHKITVFYRSLPSGDFFLDILVENCVIVEIKAVKELLPEHDAQVLNYLRATIYEVGLLLNFGPEPTIKRLSFDNERKGNRSWIKQ